MFREPVWCVWYDFLLGIIAADRGTVQGTRVEFWAVRTGKSVKFAKKAPKQGIWDELALQVGTLRRETVAVGRRAKTKGMAGCLGCRVLSLVKFQMEERFRTKAKAEGLIDRGKILSAESRREGTTVLVEIRDQTPWLHMFKPSRLDNSTSQSLYLCCTLCRTPWGIATCLFACVLVVTWDVGGGQVSGGGELRSGVVFHVPTG